MEAGVRMPYRKVGTLEWICYMIKLKFENLIWPDDDEMEDDSDVHV